MQTDILNSAIGKLHASVNTRSNASLTPSEAASVIETLTASPVAWTNDVQLEANARFPRAGYTMRGEKSQSMDVPLYRHPPLPAASANAAETVKDIDAGGFDDWSLADFAAQCRMQSREQLDPEFSKFMAALATRLTVDTR